MPLRKNISPRPNATLRTNRERPWRHGGPGGGHGSLTGHQSGGLRRRTTYGRSRDIGIGKFVPNTVDRQDIARPPRIRLELPPDVLDVRIDGALERFHL